MHPRTLTLLFGAFVALAATPSRACSLDPDYFPPSSFELVQVAQAIVIASAEEGYGALPDGGIVFRIESALKGAPPERVRLDGVHLVERVERSDLGNLSAAHPEAYSGSCDRQSFARGGRYLLFLERDSGGVWRQLSFAFARINEDYSGEDNEWMRSVRRYLRLQRTLPPMEQIAALERLAEERRDEQGGPLPAEERADIVRHLRSISPWKPTAWLIDIYGRVERGDALPFAFAEAREVFPGPPPIEWPEGSAGRILDDADATLAREAPPPEAVPTGVALRRSVLRALAEGDHPEGLPLVERLFAAPDTDRRLRGSILGYLAKNGRFPLAYRWIERHLLTELDRVPNHEARDLLVDVANALRGGSWTEGEERWRGDAHAAATWPALARRIHARQRRMFRRHGTLPFYDLRDGRR